jgi:hypothetical protein
MGIMSCWSPVTLSTRLGWQVKRLPMVSERSGLAGGGVAGSPDTGLLAGLVDAGNDVTDAGLMIGAAGPSPGTDRKRPLARCCSGGRRSRRPSTRDGLAGPHVLAAALGAAIWKGPASEERWRRIGAFALAAKTVPEAVRREAVARGSRLTSARAANAARRGRCDHRGAPGV